MMPQPGQMVYNFDTLPDDLQRTLTFLDIKQEYFTSQQLLSVLIEKCPHLVVLFYTLIMDQLLAQNADHLLVRVKQLFNFEVLDKAAASYYKNNGLGKPRDYEASQLVRILLMRWLMCWSYRTTAEHLRYDWLACWFADLSLLGPKPSHQTIKNFETWIIENHPDLFFGEVVRQLMLAFPEDDWQTQIGDTFACLSVALFETIPRLLRHTCHLLLKRLAKADRVLYAELFAELDMKALFGDDKEYREYFWTDEQRKKITAQIVRQALALLEWIQARLDRLATKEEDEEAGHVRRLVRQLQKILKDDFIIKLDDETGELSIKKRPKGKKGSYRIGGATDAEATTRLHGERRDFGYNIGVLGTEHFLTGICAFTGGVPDSDTIMAPVRCFHGISGFYPDNYLYDRGAGWGRCIAQIDEMTDGKTRLVVQMVNTLPNGRFGPPDFTLSEDRGTLTCPDGRSSTRAYRSSSANGVTFRFTKKDCAGCEMVADCRKTKEGEPPTIKGNRSVFISDYNEQVAEARAYNLTDKFRLQIKKRPIIERHIAGLVRYNGAREAIFTGTKKVDYQMKMAATCFNLKRWISRLAKAGKKTRKNDKSNILSFGRLKYKLPKPMPLQA